ncbi:unnamed protein product [Mytilus edulis]|uniref:Tyr recombinase domain-containing protein n=1 Tax=Mytilus edulis TaxID=6550 RepID=A0A8S3TGU0_MYTED|nr:unnamed protein product [Mytilus edulis]
MSILPFSGGLNQRNLSAKNLKHCQQNPVLFKIYEQYFNIVRDLNGTAFYRRPLDKGGIKFGEQSVGVNKLSNIMKTMCAEAGIDRYFTNHSGKRTCATALYQAGVPEQEIMNRTGHRSVESVRKYKRASSEMLKDISNILEPSESMCKKIKHEDNTEIQNRTENQETSKRAAGGAPNKDNTGSIHMHVKLSPKSKNRYALKAFRERIKLDETLYKKYRQFETLRMNGGGGGTADLSSGNDNGQMNGDEGCTADLSSEKDDGQMNGDGVCTTDLSYGKDDGQMNDGEGCTTDLNYGTDDGQMNDCEGCTDDLSS